MSEQDVVRIARTWLGTPYHHQASVKGAGTDCLGLIRGIWRELYGDEPEQVPFYSRDWSEPTREETLWSAARTHLRPSNGICAGAVVLFRMQERSVAKHLGIIADVGAAPTFVHAYRGHGVVESPFSVPWQRRAVSYFLFP